MKSPLKDKPLRNPGESLDKEIENVFYDEIITYFSVSLFSILWAMLEWYRWYLKLPYKPWVYSIVALIMILIFTTKFIRGKKKIKALRQGRDGEKAVGQYLERLRENGTQVFHDVPGKGFNLDHVVISKSGIYVIETKTFSKPDKGEARIIYDGEAVFLHGKIENKQPIIQVKAAVSWLIDLLNESTGKKFNIKPVVVFPGWYIEPTAESKASDVWVLNPKALPSFIGNSKTQLEDQEVKMASFHLSRYIRTCVE
jgi:hypothetical protein